MGLFDLFRRKKPISDESRKKFLYSLIDKYFGSRDKLISDAEQLIEITKYNITVETMATLLLRCVGFREMNAGWEKKTLKSLKNDCSSNLAEVELKWIFCYCDAHYVNKNADNELKLIMELGGRQMGMPSPLGDISMNYKFE